MEPYVRVQYTCLACRIYESRKICSLHFLRIGHLKSASNPRFRLLNIKALVSSEFNLLSFIVRMKKFSSLCTIINIL